MKTSIARFPGPRPTLHPAGRASRVHRVEFAWNWTWATLTGTRESRDVPRMKTPPANPLEPDSSTLRRWLAAASDLAVRHVETLADQPAAGVEDARDRLAELIEPLPEHGEDLVRLIRRVVLEYVPVSFNTAGPGYLAYIPGGGLLPAAIADLLADVTNRYVGVFAAAPLLARLEVTAVRWLADLMGYPAESRGVLTSGGSIANLIAMVCARHDRLGEAFQDGVVYVADQVHHSVTKAARFIGFAAAQVRSVETGEDFRFPVDRLAAAVTADRAAGRRPALVVASAGTTNTGAVDPLGDLADFARREELWLHVDAAYGGFFSLTERGRDRLAGIERADSITIDPHKGMFLPYGTGCILVRDGRKLLAPHRSATDYLPPLHDDELRQDFCEYSPELSRDFRGLRVWLPLKTFGVRAFRDALDEKIDLARHAADVIRATPRLHLVGEPDLSLVAFRFDDGRRRPAEELDRLNVQLLERVLAHRKVWLSGAWVKGRFTQRICVLSFRTHREHVDAALDLYRREAERLV